MGRAERRATERRNRIDDRKGKVLMSPAEITKMKKDITHDVLGYKTEALMTCFALAMYKLHGFDEDKVADSLEYINNLMDDILEDRATMEDYFKILEDEAGIIIRCE